MSMIADLNITSTGICSYKYDRQIIQRVHDLSKKAYVNIIIRTKIVQRAHGQGKKEQSIEAKNQTHDSDIDRPGNETECECLALTDKPDTSDRTSKCLVSLGTDVTYTSRHEEPRVRLLVASNRSNCDSRVKTRSSFSNRAHF